MTVNLDARGEALAALWREAEALGIFAPWIGTTGGSDLLLGAARPLPVTALKAAHEGWFPNYMADEAA